MLKRARGGVTASNKAQVSSTGRDHIDQCAILTYHLGGVRYPFVSVWTLADRCDLIRQDLLRAEAMDCFGTLESQAK